MAPRFERMTVSDALERVLADMRRRLGDDPDAAAIREAAAETDFAAVGDGSNSGRSLEEVDVDTLVAAYRDTYTGANEGEGEGESEDERPVDHTESTAQQGNAAGPQEGDVDAGADADTDRPHGAGWEEKHRVTRVAHFRDSVRTAGEWTETAGRIGPGVFDVASDARTTDGMDDQLAAQFADVDYEVRSYTLGPDDRHPSWTQILVTEPFDPSKLPQDVTIRKVEDVP